MKIAGDEAAQRTANGSPTGDSQGRWAATLASLGRLRERQQIAGHSCTTTVSHDATLVGVLANGRIPVRAGVAGAPVELASINDHGDVLVAAVVLYELRV
jgi:hypothetical protein